MTGDNWRGVQTGGDVPDDAYDAGVEQLDTLYYSEQWQSAAVEFGLVPIWRGGAAFEAYVGDQEKATADISRDIDIIE